MAKQIISDKASRKKRKVKLPPGQMTLAQAGKEQRKRSRLAAKLAAPPPYGDPVKAFWDIPHLVRAVLGSLPQADIVRVLTVDRQLLHEGVTILYRSLDFRLWDSKRAKDVCKASHGVVGVEGDGEALEGEGQSAEIKHLVQSACYRQKLYQHSVHAVVVRDLNDIEQVSDLVTTFSNLTSITDSTRSLSMTPPTTFSSPLQILSASALVAAMPRHPFPDDWDIDHEIDLSIIATPLHHTAAAMMTDGLPVLQAMRDRSPLFNSLSSLTMTAYVPHADIDALLRAISPLTKLSILSGPDLDATLHLIHTASCKVDSLVITVDPCFPPIIPVIRLFEAEFIQYLQRFRQLELPVRCSSATEYLVIYRSELVRSASTRLESVKLLFDNPLWPAVSTLARWARALGRTCTLSVDADGYILDTCIQAELCMLDATTWGRDEAVGWCKA